VYGEGKTHFTLTRILVNLHLVDSAECEDDSGKGRRKGEHTEIEIQSYGHIPESFVRMRVSHSQSAHMLLCSGKMKSDWGSLSNAIKKLVTKRGHT